MKVSYRFWAVLPLTGTPSTRAGFARSAAGRPVSLRDQGRTTAQSACRGSSAPRPGRRQRLRVDAHLLQLGVTDVPPLEARSASSCPTPGRRRCPTRWCTRPVRGRWCRRAPASRRRARPTAGGRRARSTSWKVVSKKSVLPHSVPPVSRLEAAKCLIVARVRAFSVSASMPARSGVVAAAGEQHRVAEDDGEAEVGRGVVPAGLVPLRLGPPGVPQQHPVVGRRDGVGQAGRRGAGRSRAAAPRRGGGGSATATGAAANAAVSPASWVNRRLLERGRGSCTGCASSATGCRTAADRTTRSPPTTLSRPLAILRPHLRGSQGS